MKLPTKYPELLSDLALQVRGKLIENGLHADEADRIALATAEHMRIYWGGQMVYVPTGAWYEARQQWREIWAKFTGKNVSQLAREYGLSEQQIYSIIRQMRALALRELQPDMLEANQISKAP